MKESGMMFYKADHLGRLDHFTARHLAVMAVVMALRIALSLIPALNIANLVQWGFGFIGTGIAASLFGPVYMVLFAVLYDLLDSLIIQASTVFFPGFTVSAGLAGLIYAVFLWRKKPTLKRIGLATFLVSLFINIGLNTIWLKIMYVEAWRGLIIPRIVKNAISFPLNTAVLYFILNLPSIRNVIKKFQF